MAGAHTSVRLFCVFPAKPAMVLLAPEREAALQQSIISGRARVAEELRQWHPYSPAGRRQPLQHWQAQAPSLNASFIALAKEEEALRRSQRTAWRHDEQQNRHDMNELIIDVKRSVIAFREAERLERLADTSGARHLEPQMAHAEAQFELSNRQERRQLRDRTEQRWPPRPSTAPTPKARSRARQRAAEEASPALPRGRAPPRNSAMWNNGSSMMLTGGAHHGSLRPGVPPPAPQETWHEAWRAPAAAPRPSPARMASTSDMYGYESRSKPARHFDVSVQQRPRAVHVAWQ